MDWESVGTIRIDAAGETVYRLPLSISSPLLRVRGLILNSQQISYQRVGYLRILTLDSSQVLSSLVLHRSQIVQVPDWLKLFRVEFSPMRWLDNAQVQIDKLTPDSIVRFNADLDYVEVEIQDEELS